MHCMVCWADHGRGALIAHEKKIKPNAVAPEKNTFSVLAYRMQMNKDNCAGDLTRDCGKLLASVPQNLTRDVSRFLLLKNS